MLKVGNLMQKEMTRKEFLVTLGFGVAAVFGLSTVIQLLTGKDPLQQHNSFGYGAGPYGGVRK
jgi:hypothetical protein